MIYRSSNSRGFAILYAVLMVSIVLTISLTLLDISYKQLVLSSINKESKIAYYAAVSALSCVNYWDKVVNNSNVNYYPFGYFSGQTLVPPPSNESKLIACAGSPSFKVAMTNPVSGQHLFTFPINFEGDAYAMVKVLKIDGQLSPIVESKTLIQVDGFNTPNGSRRVQRSIDSD
ncbi:MAG: hypothetical protein AAB415_02565 [Patescibacteria group bacterium]